MNYEQKYKKALEWMRSVYDELHGATKEDAEHYFPELKESEDERIRKAIIGYISHGQHYGVSNTDMITWLENQNKTVHIRLLPEALSKHLYTCVNKTNTYVRSEEDHITLIELINKIIADLNIE